MRSVAVLALSACMLPAWPAEPLDVQRQLQERDRSDVELRLKMQQQQYRAVNPPPAESGETAMRQLERDQQVREREALDQAARDRAAQEHAPDAVAGAREANRRLRAQREAHELQQRFERERETESARSAREAPR